MLIVLQLPELGLKFANFNFDYFPIMKIFSQEHLNINLNVIYFLPLLAILKLSHHKFFRKQAQDSLQTIV